MNKAIHHRQKLVLLIIVTAQFFCTSLWFAGNAILPDLQSIFSLPVRALGDLTSAVQFGFITGTLLFATLTIADRYSPSRVFFVCSVLGSLVNLLIIYADGLVSLIVLRALTGFCLAGIYPVGMKISSDYFEQGLGRALGFLVGALVLGTALPHFISVFTYSLDWHYVIYATSTLAAVGGFLIFILIPDGPFRKKGSRIDLRISFRLFKESNFRKAAFGYFGHMWELYTLWAFIPLIVSHYNSLHPTQYLDVSLWSAVVIGSGGIACILGGFVAEKIGSNKTAFIALSVSGLCCLCSIFLFASGELMFLAFLLIWGMAVVADSPQFSTLVARYAPKESTGSALTIVNSIGFAITIISLQTMSLVLNYINFELAFVGLAIGPLFGLLSMRKSVATP